MIVFLGREVYVVDMLRTAFTRFSRREPEKDPFYEMRSEEIAGRVVRGLIERNNLNPNDIDDILVGSALQVGEQWLYGGRHVVFAARLPETIPAAAVDRQCASSITTVVYGALEIASGMADIVIAGGVEKMSRVPMYDNPHIDINPRFTSDPEYAEYELGIGYIMGLTAEKLAEESGIGREEMDRWALISHQRAWKAYQEGYFKKEILPIEIRSSSGRMILESDQAVRPDTTLEKLLQLPPAFKPGGVITAGNSSPLSSGSAFVLLMSKEALSRYSLQPLAKIRSFAFAGVKPSVMGKGPVPASLKALNKAGLKVRDIGLWEINEAFAVVTLYAIKQLGIEEERVNKRGGAIAIGHPLGATGARIIGTLARQMVLEGVDYGVATLCVGGGQGASLVLERV
ncbi:MAG: acetyl-CoA C-acetyltransferase [Sulfolobales archaeon]